MQPVEVRDRLLELNRQRAHEECLSSEAKRKQPGLF